MRLFEAILDANHRAVAGGSVAESAPALSAVLVGRTVTRYLEHNRP